MWFLQPLGVGFSILSRFIKEWTENTKYFTLSIIRDYLELSQEWYKMESVMRLEKLIEAHIADLKTLTTRTGELMFKRTREDRLRVDKLWESYNRLWNETVNNTANE